MYLFFWDWNIPLNTLELPLFALVFLINLFTLVSREFVSSKVLGQQCLDLKFQEAF